MDPQRGAMDRTRGRTAPTGGLEFGSLGGGQSKLLFQPRPIEELPRPTVAGADFQRTGEGGIGLILPAELILQFAGMKPCLRVAVIAGQRVVGCYN